MSRSQTSNPPKPLAPFIVYLMLFHAVWIEWVYGVYPWMVRLGDTTLTYALVNVGLRLLIWVLPVFLYLRYIDHVDPIVYLKLGKNWRRGVVISLALTAVNLVLSMLRFGIPDPTMQSVTWNSVLSTSILIGFIEEIPFRDFILQKFQERCTFWVANLLTTVLFITIHVPGWYALELLRADTVGFVVIFSLLMGVVFRSSGSLWSVIVTHSLNDFLAGIIFRT